jgi:hypothetical protein
MAVAERFIPGRAGVTFGAKLARRPDRVVGDLLVTVLGHVADGDPELGRRVDVDVVEADAVAHDRAAGLQTREVGAVERDDRAGEDRDGLALDR